MSSESKPRSGRRLAGGAVTVAVLLAGAGSAWWWTSHRVPPADGPATDVVRFVADDRFKEMSAAQKQAYVERLESMPVDQRRALARDAGLTTEQGRAAYRNIYDQAVRNRINKYYTLKTDAERNAYLDHLIDEFKREQMFTKPEGGDPGKGSLDPSKAKSRLENVSAGDRQKAAAFMKAFMQRGILRGLGFARPAGR